MRIPDYILIAAIVAGVVLALRSISRRKSHGGCCSGCGGCCNTCSHPCDADQAKPHS